jgi:hypothetical protein
MVIFKWFRRKRKKKKQYITFEDLKVEKNKTFGVDL